MAVVSSAVALGVGAVASGVGNFVSARSQRNAAERNARNQLNSIQSATDLRNSLINEAGEGTYLDRYGTEDIFGTRGEELSLDDATLDSIATNTRNFAETDAYTRRVNDTVSDQAIDRAVRFDPNFNKNVASLSNTSRSLLRGEIPEDVSRELLRDRAEFSVTNGVPGSYGAATARDLGLTRLDLQRQGADFFNQVNGIRDQVDPISRHLSQRNYVIDPTAQLQLEQYNNQIRSQADPAAAQLFGLEIQGGTQDAYAAAGVDISSGISPFGNALGSFGSNATGFGTLAANREQQRNGIFGGR